MKGVELLHQKIKLADGFKYYTVCDSLPNSALLKNNAMFRSLVKEQIFLSHQTKHIPDILNCKIIKRGWGCLGKVLYVTPNYILSDNAIRRDNFFELVLSHQQQHPNSPQVKELIVSLSAQTDGCIWGTNYLRAGPLLFFLAENLNLPLEGAKKKTDEILKSEYLKRLLRGASDYTSILSAISMLAKKDMFFAYIYYEAVSQVVMLSCVDERTQQLKRNGEFNSACYYSLFSHYARINTDRFDVSVFNPSALELRLLLDSMQEAPEALVLDTELALKNIAMNICEILQNLKKESEIPFHVFFAGQFLRTTLSSKDQSRLMDSFNLTLHSYRLQNNIQLVVNTATLKAELGLVDESPARTNYYASANKTSELAPIKAMLEKL